METKSLDQQIFKSTLLPAIVFGIALIAASYALETIRKTHTTDNALNLSHDLLAAAVTHDRLDTDKFKKIAKTLLNFETISSVQLYDNSRKKILTSGIPVEIDAPYLKLKDNTVWQQGPYSIHILRFANTQGWLVLSTPTSKTSLDFYQEIILLLVYIAIFAIYTYYKGRQLRLLIIKPLRTVHNGIKRLVSGNYTSEIPIQKNTLYAGVINQINQLALQQQYAAVESQKAIDQSTAELRETLETVEIQNIEIDLARKNAIKENQQKSEFLSNASHEIRTPLNGIIGFTELLKETELSLQQGEYLSTIEESAKSLLISINDIIDYSRLEIGKLNLDYKPVPIRQIIEEASLFLAPRADTKNLRLICIVDKKIPRQLLGDPLRIKQVLTNLISNIIGYAVEGNIQINVSMEARNDNQVTLKFKITSSYTKLSSESINEIQTLCSQETNSDIQSLDKHDMGLVIARGLTRRMQGHIGILRSENKGVSFWFTATLGRTNLEIVPELNQQSLAHINAIIFDKDPVGRMEIEHLLSSWGAKTTVATEFKDIATIARAISKTNIKPVVILDALLGNNAFTKHDIEHLVTQLEVSPAVPIVAIVPPALQHVMAPLLPSHISLTLQRPIISKTFFELLCKRLGIVESNLSATEDFKEPTKQKASQPTKTEKVLVVDDNNANVKLVCELLKDLDLLITTANSGEEAIEKYSKQSPFSLIFMDIQMPGLNGFETTQQIRKIEQEKNWPRTPITALTAHAVEEEKPQILLSGMDDFASKPVGKKELSELIQRWTSTPIKPIPTTSVRRPTAAPKSEIIDPKLALTRANNNSGLALDMFNMLVESLESDRIQLIHDHKNKQYDTLYETIHKIHGGCCYCAIPKLHAVIQTLDSALKKQDYSNLEKQLNRVFQEIEKVIDWKKKNDFKGHLEIAEKEMAQK